ncbi:tyrosine-type recombinase/integrase [Bradyrhizobium sp. sGM-13]|uniref:tyrosine-type recombinase/integrase n=1 Tax=Bradyrhizobium sp. sGM-13 TaxID=2831781 RepID=UPI0035C87BB5
MPLPSSGRRHRCLPRSGLVQCLLYRPRHRRHSAAMEPLQAGVDCSVIAPWLGHESVETTQTYLHVHLALKEAALAKLKPYERGKRTRFQPNDRLLAFLEAL